ncbi:MAG: terminase small subunit [Methylococcaceae bacterium]|nr:terminase small subunit [Methylococcaceae bacterium]
MIKSLTFKQERFAQLYVSLGNAVVAYKFAYNCENMKPATVSRKATELITNDAVTERINQLKAETTAHHKITRDDIAAMFLQDRAFAIECEAPTAAILATTGLARLYGLDKQINESHNEKVKIITENEDEGNS